jgi:hypothetical protein
LEAVVLGGGYGRGEGGVLSTPLGDRPYNDLEFYVFVRNNRLVSDWRYSAALRELGERLSSHAGLHVEFKIETAARLRQGQVSMYNYDLVAGHRVIIGIGVCFQGCEHLLRPERIQPVEATRLLFNRCTGLLLARDFLKRDALTADQADFVVRNLAKAQLAVGDAVLTAFGLYHWSSVERKERLDQFSGPFPWLSALRIHHRAGVQFKLHPYRVEKTPQQLRPKFCEVSELTANAWLWLESRRLKRRLTSIEQYACCQPSRASGNDAWRNLVLNLRTFGWGAALDGVSLHYPRERLFRALALLLWQDPTENASANTRRLQRLLNSRASDWADLATVYKAAWSRFG